MSTRTRRIVLPAAACGAIAADLIGRHPADANAVLLLACGCDPQEVMTRFMREHSLFFPKKLPNPSLLPLDLASEVPRSTHVRMVIGERDDVVRMPASQAYASALASRGVDVKLVIAPGFGHNTSSARPRREPR